MSTECRIEWNVLSLEDWNNIYSGIPRASLLQSYDYARAVCTLQKKRAQWGHIFINGQSAGIVQTIEISILGRLFHTIELDMGPLWREGFGTTDHIRAFFKTLNKQAPKRPGRKRRILPGTLCTPENTKIFGDLKIKNLPRPGYQTIWLDLRPDKDTLRSNLHGKWRNMLNKSEKKKLSTSFTTDISELPSILKGYERDKKLKNYDGPSSKLIRLMAAVFSQQNNVLIGQAKLDNRVVAAIVIFIHGRSATYQIGWTTDDGRDCAAHNLLLWEAMMELKDRNILDFDLGGTNDESAKRVKNFKEGMGGQTTHYLGHYI